jgi:AcrR family transcriptional regulator
MVLLYGTVRIVVRRSKDDWAAIALRALAEGGPAAVAVEPLAAAAGATKGSVYWHFPNRDALLAAALERWEREQTDRVIAAVERQGSPKARLTALFVSVLETRGPHVELALLTAAEDPMVAAAVRRVTERRLDYVAKLFRELGLTAAQARNRAALAYSIYLGHAQLVRSTPGTVDALPKSYLDEAMGMLARP